ncbi:FtsX-like permease family protein [Ferrimonas pelagia]|uniref:ABC transporter permease n=1 Tax=Ferrimonas pelagia TaxID=1177826 RepID=A0ABP9F8W6_9GAMM
MPNATLSILKNYLTTAVRALLKQKLHTGLNLLGLSLGLTAALLIALWVRFELSYDRFHPNVDNSYRLVVSDPQSGKRSANFSGPVAEFLRQQSELKHLLAMHHFGSALQRDSERFFARDYFVVDESLLSLFAITALHGDLQQTFDEPNQVALSQRQANRLFGAEQVVGETLLWGNTPLTVSAVFADLPDNTHLPLQGFIGFETWWPRNGHVLESQDNQNLNLYLQTPSGTDAKQLAELLTEKLYDFAGPQEPSFTLELQPITDIHLHSNTPFPLKSGGSAQAVYTAIGLSLCVLLIATFNFVNLSTARAGLRAKEVGVRKALGANRRQLISQFLFEALLLTATAALLACVWAELALPHFNRLMNSALDIHYLGDVGPLLLTMVLAVGLLAGAYPALYLSSFNSARVLSGDLTSGHGALRTRRLLIGLQSAISIGLIVASFGVIAQLLLLQSQPLGYSKEQRLVIRDLPNGLLRSADNFGRVLHTTELVSHWTLMDKDPTRQFNMRRSANSNGEQIDGIIMKMGYDDLAAALGLELIAGRDFSAEFRGDRYDPDAKTVGIILNRQAALAAGFAEPQDALHQVWQLGELTGTIVGVVEDYKAGPDLDDTIPLFFTHSHSALGSVDAVVQLKEAISPQQLSELRRTLQRPLPAGFDLDIRFLDAIYQAQFDQQRRQFVLLLSMTAVALTLTVIGLFGLAAFSCERRSKEIAMRKVLGSSYASIVALINKEFVALVALGSLLAWPLAHWGLNRWLEHFLHRVELAWWWFPAATVVVLAITVATVSALALNTARQRPALTLRDE